MKDSREISCESDWKLNSIHRDIPVLQACDRRVRNNSDVFIVSAEELSWKLILKRDMI